MVTRVNKDLKRIGKAVKPDAKMRVVLPKTLVREDIIYHIYTNSIGQIVLDPQVTIPASEAWLFKDKTALALMDKGMVESTNGQAIDRGSFKKYAKNAP
jgi:hypothetical protein